MKLKTYTEFLSESRIHELPNGQVLFDKLVPGAGKASTLEGELLRAITLIIYRYNNDGDLFYEDYGIEVLGSSVVFLFEESPRAIQYKIKGGIQDAFNADYVKEITYLYKTIVDYIESLNGKYTPNRIDSRKYFKGDYSELKDRLGL